MRCVRRFNLSLVALQLCAFLLLPIFIHQQQANAAVVLPLNAGLLNHKKKEKKFEEFAIYFCKFSVLFNEYDENGDALNLLVDGLKSDVELLDTTNRLAAEQRRQQQQQKTTKKRGLLVGEDPLLLEPSGKEVSSFLARNMGGNFGGIGIGTGGAGGGAGGLIGNCFCCRAFVCRRQTCPCSKFVF